MIRRPPRSTQSRSSAASDVYKRQVQVVGTCVLKIQLGETATESLTIVCEDIFCSCILSWQNLRALGVIGASFPSPSPPPPRAAALATKYCTMPFTPSPEDEAALVQCTKDLKQSFPSVLSDTLSDSLMITDSPMAIIINPSSEVNPLNIATARAIPWAYEAESLKVTGMLRPQTRRSGPHQASGGL